MPSELLGFVFTFHVSKGELGKREAKNKALSLTLAAKRIILNVCHAVEAEQGEGEGFSVSEQGNKVPLHSADSHFSEGLS